MSQKDKIKATHLQRPAYIYVRQSTPGQVEHNRESTQRQYRLVERAIELGWPRTQTKVIDGDLAQSGRSAAGREGFTSMTTQVALGHVGVILTLEVSRVARNNSDWYRLLDLCSVSDTLIGDEDGLYHPGLFNDRLLLGLKGTMAEAELHVIRARLDGGIRNKAARGELRRGLPVGLIWGEADGEILKHPDEAVSGAISTIFEKFSEMGSARRVWLFFRSENILFPLQRNGSDEIKWITPSYTAIHHVLSNPAYAGAYTYGKTRTECYVDGSGQVCRRVRHLPKSEWAVLIPEHHQGYIDWETYEMNKVRLAGNTHPRAHSDSSGAVREGSALLQGLSTCGNCGRRLKVFYQGKNSTPGYYCSSSNIANGRGVHCLCVGGLQLDRAVANAFLAAVHPAALKATLLAEQQLDAQHDATLQQWRLQVERAKYESDRAERRYRTVEPENRLVARTLEVAWEQQLAKLAEAKTELSQREQRQPQPVTDEQRHRLMLLGNDLSKVWDASSSTDRDRKELLRTILEEVNVRIDREKGNAHLILRWRGGAISELDVNIRTVRIAPNRTDEDTVELVRRLTELYRDDIIAGVLNRQGRRTVSGERFTANRVGNLRRSWKIPRCQLSKVQSNGELFTIEKTAEILGIASSTVHRWLSDGFIAGEQLTPGAPWRIRVNEQLRKRFIEYTPPGHVPMLEATRLLGVSRQTILQRVKRGELDAVHVRCGRRKGLRIKIVDAQPSLFNNFS